MVTVLLFLAVSAWLALRFNGIAFLISVGSNTAATTSIQIEVNEGAIPPDASYAVQFVIAATSQTTLIAIFFGVGAGIFPLEVVSPKPRTRLALRAGGGRGLHCGRPCRRSPRANYATGACGASRRRGAICPAVSTGCRRAVC